MKVKIPLSFVLIVTVAMIIAVTPEVFADSGDNSKTHHMKYAISIGDASGTLQITEENSKEMLKGKAISLEEATKGYTNIQRAHLTKAVNNLENYYLVWKLVSASEDAWTGAKTFTVYVVDAGTGDLLTSMTKEGGSCGDKTKTTTGKQV